MLRRHRARKWLPLVAALVLGSPVTAAPARHTVYAGQTLGMIAKRYNVTVDALCEWNGIRRNAPIKPGQELLIPGKGAPPSAPSGKTNREDAPRPKGKPRVHVVESGQTLGKIAHRYDVEIGALCHANGISPRAAITPEQHLIVPAPGDSDGSDARRLRLAGLLDDDDDPKGEKRSSGGNWRTFVKGARRAGFVTLRSHGGSWKGYVIGPGGRVLPKGREKVSDTLASWRTGKRVDIDPRLIALIARVSDTFGGRPIDVVSGYREHSHVATSRHPHGRALDFGVEGVPNWAVRDYLRTLDGVGVGFYPNSTFVHLDVREDSAYWVDRSGPGEAPRVASQ